MATSTRSRSTVVAVFHDRSNAQQAIRDLKRAGFREDQIGLVARHEDGPGGAEPPSETNLAAGAGIGAAAGAGIGALWALGIATLGFPALGPVLVGGTLMAALLASAGGGAAIGTLLGSLIGLGIPEEEAKYYEGEVHAGRTVVTVKAEGRFDEAWQLLTRHGAYDMHSADGARTAAPAQTSSGTARPSIDDTGRKVELHKEQLRPATQPGNAGEEVKVEQGGKTTVANEGAKRRK